MKTLLVLAFFFLACGECGAISCSKPAPQLHSVLDKKPAAEAPAFNAGQFVHALVPKAANNYKQLMIGGGVCFGVSAIILVSVSQMPDSGPLDFKKAFYHLASLLFGLAGLGLLLIGWSRMETSRRDRGRESVED